MTKVADPASISKAFRKFLLGRVARLGIDDITGAPEAVEALIAILERLEREGDHDNLHAFVGFLTMAPQAAAIASQHPEQTFCSVCAAMGIEGYVQTLLTYGQMVEGAPSDAPRNAH